MSEMTKEQIAQNISMIPDVMKSVGALADVVKSQVEFAKSKEEIQKSQKE